ncbi:hypothetical protein G6F37_013090 [Rhizopus arrhizus]|nr:hypothetical protein G6F38_012002 [Rhizopus arrhizus]KAG1139828.1 hypothetical protein G6F37_013090 [Rhizopus arrhizus]
MYFNSLLATLIFSSVLAVPVKREAGGIYRSCIQPKQFALTFDDGPSELTWNLATKLHEEGVQATFFINGKNWVDVEQDSVSTPEGEKSYMEVIRHYKDMGHEIGSHTYEHQVLTGASEETIRDQMNKESDIIYKAIGERPALMRPPQGDLDSTAVKVLGDLGYSIILWDIDTKDWETHDLASEQEAYKTVFDREPTKGHIALQHEVYAQTVNDLVPWILDYVKSKGYTFVPVSQCIGANAYQ